MSGYIAFPMTAPAAAAFLTRHYGFRVSDQMVRRVFDAIGDGLRVGQMRLILQETLDQIMAAIEREHYVFPSSSLVHASNTPPITAPWKPATIPEQSALSQRQEEIHLAPEQPKPRGRRSTRR